MSPAPLSPESAKTNAILAWLFAPFTSFVWRNSENELLSNHAKESYYLGVLNLVAFAILFVLQICYSVFLGSLFYSSFYFGIGTLVSCVWWILWLIIVAFVSIPRIMGIMKASKRETWRISWIPDSIRKALDKI